MESDERNAVRSQPSVGVFVGAFWATRKRVIALVSIALPVLTFLCLVVDQGKQRASGDFSTMIGLCIGWILVISVYPWLCYTLMLRDPALTGEYELTVGEDGVVARNSKMETNYRWEAFTKLSETRRLLLLYVGKAKVIAIPKAAFESEGHVKRFRDAVNYGIGHSTQDGRS